MTIDNYGQGIIDFSEVFPAAKRRRRKLKPSECVPAERVKVLADVRQVCGITLQNIADISGISQPTLSKMLTLNQGICPEEFELIKSALADVVFRKILASVNGGRRP